MNSQIVQIMIILLVLTNLIILSGANYSKNTFQTLGIK